MAFVEETAGVSYYNQVKHETLRNIENKEPQMQSNNNTIQKLEEKSKNLETNFEKYKNYKNYENEYRNLINKIDQLKQ